MNPSQNSPITGIRNGTAPGVMDVHEGMTGWATGMPTDHQSNKVIAFDFRGLDIRAVSKGGEPWFIAADVCRVIDIGNPSQAMTSLDDDEKDTLINNEGGIAATATGIQSFNIINESGLYSLILRSRKPEAKAFKKWITSEVLPALRKTGSYSVGFVLPKTFAESLRLLASEVEKTERLALEVASMAPKAEFYDAVTASQDTLDMNRACKVLGVGRNRFMAALRKEKVFTHQNVPMQCYIDSEYFAVSESRWEHPTTGESHITLSTRVLQKGLEFLRRKAIELGLIEPSKN